MNMVLLFLFGCVNTFGFGAFVASGGTLFSGLGRSSCSFLLVSGCKSRMSIGMGCRSEMGDTVVAFVVNLVMTVASMSDVGFTIGLMNIFLVAFFMFGGSCGSIGGCCGGRLRSVGLGLPCCLGDLRVLVRRCAMPITVAEDLRRTPRVFGPNLERLVTSVSSNSSAVRPCVTFTEECPIESSVEVVELLCELDLNDRREGRRRLVMFSEAVSGLRTGSESAGCGRELRGVRGGAVAVFATAKTNMVVVLMLSVVRRFATVWGGC